MNEAEVAQLATQVGEVDPYDPIVLAWLATQQEGCRVQIKQLQAAFRLHRFLRHDEQMTTIAKSLEELRATLSALDNFAQLDPERSTP